jgi:hypothetical protein
MENVNEAVAYQPLFELRYTYPEAYDKINSGLSATLRLRMAKYIQTLRSHEDVLAKTLQGDIPCTILNAWSGSLSNTPWLHLLLNGFDPRNPEEILERMRMFYPAIDGHERITPESQVVSTAIMPKEILATWSENDRTTLWRFGIQAPNRKIRKTFFGTAAKMAMIHKFCLNDWLDVHAQYGIVDVNTLEDRKNIFRQCEDADESIIDYFLTDPTSFTELVQKGRGDLYNGYILGLPPK